MERFQGSCLHLHYRTAFRYLQPERAGHRRRPPGLAAPYNFERPHRGYRTAGRTPASIFYTHRPSLLKVKGWDRMSSESKRALSSRNVGPTVWASVSNGTYSR